MENAVREQHHVRLNNAVKRLALEKNDFENLLAAIRNDSMSKTVGIPPGPKEKPEELSLSEILQSIPDTIYSLCDSLAKCREEMRQLLF